MDMSKIQKLNEDYFDDVYALSEFAFQYKLTDEEKRKKRKETQRHSIWGWIEDGELAAKVHIIPLQIHLQKQVFKMGGIASVATWPEYRRGGKIRQLLRASLYEMKEKGQIVSLLHPFSIPFYRKFGWELTFSHREINIPINKLKKNWNTNGYLRRKKNNEETIEILHTAYTNFASQFAGPLDRDKNWWRERVLNNDDIIAVAYNENKDLEGYIVYHVKNNILRVRDMAYQSLNGRQLLYQFISNHDSMALHATMRLPENHSLDLLVEDPNFEQKSISYFMSRIVDVEAFLKKYPYRMPADFQPFALKVEDSFMEENSGTYVMEKTASGISVLRVQKAEDIPTLSITVQQLAVVFFGYQRPSELSALQLIDGDKGAWKRLEDIIAKQQAYFPDFF